MNAQEIIVLALGFLGGCAYAASYKMKKKQWAIVIKGVASSLFVLLGALCCLRRFDRYSMIALTGLFLGAAADVVFGLRHVYKEKKNFFFKIGVGIFAAGHIAYIFAFNSLAKAPLYYYAIAVGIGLLVCAVPKFFFKAHYGRLGPIIVVYASILAAMLLCASYAAFSSSLTLNRALLFGAASLFTISDIVLLFQTFVKDNFALNWANLLPYYSGQLLFALTIGFIVR